MGILETLLSPLPDAKRGPLSADEQAIDNNDAEATRLLDTYRQETKRTRNWDVNPINFASGNEILAANPALQVTILHRILDVGGASDHGHKFHTLMTPLLTRSLPVTISDIERLLEHAAHADHFYHWGGGHLLRQARRVISENSGTLTPALRSTLQKLHKQLHTKGWGRDAQGRKWIGSIEEMLGNVEAGLPEPGEAWTDAAVADIADLPSEAKAAWTALFGHARTAEGPAKPSAKWLKEAGQRVKAVGESAFVASVLRWFNLVRLPDLKRDEDDWYDMSGLSAKNVTLLKGLAWMCATRSEPEIARALARLAEACFQKVPYQGAWAQRAGLAAIWALGEMPGTEAVAQLGILKRKVANRPTLAQIEKAIEGAAARAGMTREQMEDLAVPTYGFAAEGTRRENFDDCRCEVTIRPTGRIETAWFGPGDRPLKSVPASVKRDHADAFKTLKSDTDTTQKMLTAQQYRFETFLLAERVWDLQTLRARVFAHPLLGSLGRRLIWHFSDTSDRKTQGIWNAEQEQFTDVEGHSLDWLTDATEARLWHPLGFDTESVLQWRRYLEERGIVQPFKQAHREVYVLTDAELNTSVYSNRFAGHLLRQHQMNMLAKQKGWKFTLSGGWDGGYDEPASIMLPRWNLRAEFWAEPVSGRNGNADLSDSGIYLYLSTDQVRFYDTSTEARLPLTEVPALPFSEVMRDVDLFVGVASVGNDPAWADGGPEGQYRAYWHDYSFGDLSQSAQTRGEVLARLLPRLKIASRCRIEGRFLRVQGDLRTYKIHLGSGNILMEPNDQYLCIVADRKEATGDTANVFLPFEGDNRLALILSKAFLLADDTKIKDATIVSQIRQR